VDANTTATPATATTATLTTCRESEDGNRCSYEGD
jgi:hypothetical protein